MNKAVLLVALAFVGMTVAQYPSCGNQYKCVSSGQSCINGGNTTNNLPGTLLTLQCPSGQYCNIAGSGTCTNLIANGQSCSTANPCVIGSYCASDNTCKSNQFNTAVGGACVASPGDYSNGCVAGLLCIASVCVAPPQTGDACNAGACYGANSCIGGKCVAWGSVASGQPCSSSSKDCAAGLFCNMTGVASTGVTYACAAPAAAASGANCNATTSCSGGEVCGCSNAGTALTSQCYLPTTYSSSDLKTLIDNANCMLKNCAQNNKNCGGCGNCDAAAINNKAPKTTVTNQCITCSSGGAMVAASLVFVTIAAFFAL